MVFSAVFTLAIIAAVIAFAYFKWGRSNRVTATDDDDIDPRTEAIFNRGVALWNDKNYDEAILVFGQVIELHPGGSTESAAHCYRGDAWAAKKEHDRANQDFDEAIRLDPKYALAIHRRGRALAAKKEYDRAIRDYDEAIRLDDRFAFFFDDRGLALAAKSEFERALNDYDKAIRLDLDNYAFASAHKAWLLATCPNAKYRDGTEAVELATRACKLTDWKDASCWEVLAAAHAEAGDFDQAIQWQQKALENRQPVEELDAQRRKRLDLYRAGKPCRMQ